MVSFRQLVLLGIVGPLGLLAGCYGVDASRCTASEECESPLYCHPSLEVCLKATEADLDENPELAREIGCGNKRLDEGEECDDGNDITTDSCHECKNATCGDGQVRTDLSAQEDGYETCDDGNPVDDDGCSNNC